MKKLTYFLMSIVCSCLIVISCCTTQPMASEQTTVDELALIEQDIINPSVIIIAGPQTGSGTVVYQDKKHAYILTANHVIDKQNSLFARQAYKETLEFETVKIIYQDIEFDQAILESAPVWRGVAHIIAQDKDLVLFTKGFVYGFPGGQAGPINGILSEGRISLKDDLSLTGKPSTIASISICFGNSGGGLFVKKDNHYILVGIVHCILARPGEFDRIYVFHISGYSTPTQMMEFLKLLK